MTQPLSLAEQLKNLEQLQEIDLKIDALKRNQTSLPEGLRELDEALGKLKSQFDLKTSQISELEKTQRQTLAAMELNSDRLTRANQKLEGVHNSQEFQAANKEIDQLKKSSLSLEETNKKAIADLDTLRAEAKSLGAQVETMKAERDAKAAVVTTQDHQFKADISTLSSEKTAFSSKVEARILAQYNRVRVARNGLGLVPALGGRCKGCNMMLPPQLFNVVQRGTELQNCPSCHRILYVPVAADGAGSKAESGS